MQQIPDAGSFNEVDEYPSAPLGPEAIREQLNRILASRIFHAAQGQRTFLQFTVEQAIAGRGHLLKEYVIGVEALGRGESFDPRLDPIVRTQARKLRARLTKYYETEGLHDPIQIDFPKGSYLPSFCRTSKGGPVLPCEIPPIAIVPLQVTQPEVCVAASQHSQFERPWLLGKNWKLTALSLGIAFILGLSLFAFYVRKPVALAANEEASIAVMPIVNLEEAGADEFLSDGFTDELITSLRTVAKLRVIAHASVFDFKNKSVPLQEIGRKLRVRTVLVGSLRRSKERLQITVQLNSVPNGYHLWSGSFDRPATELPAIESEIVKHLTGVLGVALNDGGSREMQSMLSEPPLLNPTAQDSYLRGLQSWHRLTPDGLLAATHFFQNAIAEDPSFARAYAALADCYVVAPQFASARTSSLDTATRIRKFAARALELDPSLGEAHFDLAVSSEYAFDWAMADKEFKQGLTLSPGNAVGHLWYAKYLALVGRKAEVLSHRKTAAALDPVSAYAAQSVAGYFSVMGLYDAAIAQFRGALSLEPNFALAHQGLGFTYLLAGRRDEALTELQIADHLLAGPYREALLGYAYGVCGETQDAKRILSGLLEQSRTQPFPAVTIAHVYIGLGDKDRAFEWLEKAVDQRDLSVDLLWDPVYRTMRPDPRYSALLRRMKLS